MCNFVSSYVPLQSVSVALNAMCSLTWLCFSHFRRQCSKSLVSTVSSLCFWEICFQYRVSKKYGYLLILQELLQVWICDLNEIPSNKSWKIFKEGCDPCPPLDKGQLSNFKLDPRQSDTSLERTQIKTFLASTTGCYLYHSRKMAAGWRSKWRESDFLDFYWPIWRKLGMPKYLGILAQKNRICFNQNS